MLSRVWSRWAETLTLVKPEAVIGWHRLHVNVTAHPYAEWTAQQIVEALGADGAFKFLIRDRDRIFGAAFDQRVNNLGIRQLRISPRSPWQNGYAERLIGTFRRELPITSS